MTEDRSRKTFPIRELIESFPDGDQRFVDTHVSLRLSWFPEIVSPDFTDQLMSDYAMSSEESSISSGFFEEVSAITDLLEKRNVHPKPADWQKTDISAANKMYDGLNLRAMALTIWDWYAIPLRLKGKTVYRIWAPRDVAGTPIIKEIPLDAFLSLVAQKTAEDKIELARRLKRVERWQSAAIVLGVVVLIFILIYWS